MASSAAAHRHNAPEDIPKYFSRHEESDGSPMNQYGRGDGYTMYRALARQLRDDPLLWQQLRHNVQDFYLWVHANQEHPLHKLLMEAQALVGEKRGTALFALLDCPDMDPNIHVLTLIACALKVRMCIFQDTSPEGEARQLRVDVGSQSDQLCVLLQKRQGGLVGSRFSSLLPDQSGKALVEFLIGTRNLAHAELQLPVEKRYLHGIRLEQVAWTFTKKNESEIDVRSFNGFRPNSKTSDLHNDAALNRIDAFVMNINDPKQIGLALHWMKKALTLAPNQQQRTRVSDESKWGTMRPHVAADCEFRLVPEALVIGKTSAEISKMKSTGEVEEICSVLTFAVHNRLVVHFNVLHMLINADKYTVPALEMLFRETIFDAELLKFWWNPQQDFRVLERTISYIYQGSSYTSTFRLSNPFLLGKRPDETQMVYEEEPCELHAPGVSDQGMACPCRLGNIDTAALLDHFCRLHGLHIPKKPWNVCRKGFNYEDLLTAMLGTDRLFPLLKYMKNCNATPGISKLQFYQSLGSPGTERDDRTMAYQYGDVMGINAVVEQLLVLRQEQKFIADKLIAYARPSSGAGKVSRLEKQRASPLGNYLGIPLFEDNPRHFRYEEYRTAVSSGGNEEIISDEKLSNTESLSYWEHNYRAKLCSRYSGDYKADSSCRILPQQEPNEITNLQRDLKWTQKRTLLKALTDPCKFTVPTTCGKIAPNDLPHRIVRAGYNYSESLIEFLQSEKAAQASPPPGFGAPAGEQWGLPAHFRRVAGADLPGAAQIFFSHQQPGTSLPGFLGYDCVRGRSIEVKSTTKSSQDLALEAIQRVQEHHSLEKDIPTLAKLAKEAAQKRIQEETHNGSSLPSFFDPTDVLDPEGRAFRRAAETAPEWNTPPILYKPPTYEDGSWKSAATERLRALEEMYPALNVRALEFRPAQQESWWAGQMGEFYPSAYTHDQMGMSHPVPMQQTSPEDISQIPSAYRHDQMPLSMQQEFQTTPQGENFQIPRHDSATEADQEGEGEKELEEWEKRGKASKIRIRRPD